MMLGVVESSGAASSGLLQAGKMCNLVKRFFTQVYS